MIRENYLIKFPTLPQQQFKPVKILTSKNQRQRCCSYSIAISIYTEEIQFSPFKYFGTGSHNESHFFSVVKVYLAYEAIIIVYKRRICCIQLRIILSIILLIREAKNLDPFLRKLRERRSVKFGTVIHYKEEERRKLTFFLKQCKITIINLNLKCWAGQPHTRGSSTTQGTVHRRRCKNTAGLESLSIYKYVKQNLWTPFYEKYVD